MKPLLALAALCLIAWTPLQQSLSKPVPVPGGPPAEGFGRTARAASDGHGFFVTSHGSEFTEDFYGVALGDAGQLLGEESSFTGYGRAFSAVASSGSNYLVVWFDRTGFSARRVTTDGRAIDRAPIDVYRLPAALVNTLTPEVSAVWDGTRYVVVIETSDGHFSARFIGEDGVVSAEEVDVIGSGLAVIPGTVLVITRRSDETAPLEVQTLTAAGAGEPIVIGNGALAVGAGGDGEFLVVYLLDTDLRAHRLDSSGHPIGAPIELESRGVIGNDFDVASVGDHWLVVFVPNTNTVKGVRVRQELIDATPFTIAENAVAPAVASNGSRALVTWRRKTGGVLEKAMVDGATVSAAGPLNRALMPVQGTFNPLANHPRMAAIGATTLVAQTSGDNVAITAITGGVARLVATIPGLNNVLEVTGGGTHALVALTRSSGLLANSVRFLVVDESGAIVGDDTVGIQPYFLSATWVAPHYVLAWTEYVEGSGTVEGKLFTARLTVDADIHGRQLWPQEVVGRPLVTAMGGQVILAWQEKQRRFAGEVLHFDFSPGGTFARPVETRGYNQFSELTVATDGNGFLVSHFDINREVVLVQHFNTDGTSAGRTRTLEVADLNPIRTWTLWNGESYLLLVAGATPKQLYAMRIGPDGMAIDAQLEPVFISDPLFDATSIKDVIARSPRELELLHASPYAPFSLPRLVLQTLTPGRRRASR